MTTSTSVSRDIAGAPDDVWSLVSDLTRMGEISPENTGGKWLAGATGPAVGAKFKGTNKNGKRQWSTTVKVTRSEKGRVFEFDTTAVGLKIARWTYEFEPAADGCRVTETWTDLRGGIAKALGKPVSGVGDREAHNREGMEQTLAALATKFEASTAS